MNDGMIMPKAAENIQVCFHVLSMKEKYCVKFDEVVLYKNKAVGAFGVRTKSNGRWAKWKATLPETVETAENML